jgi:phage-related tail protein
MAEALWEAVKGIGKFIVNMIIDILNVMFDGISKAWTWIPGAKGIPHIPKLATGTDNAQRGLALVGEAGPELVRFNGGEQVLNNRNTQKALAGIGNSGNTFNVTFNNTQDTTAYAMMSQLRQYNRQMAINGVI